MANRYGLRSVTALTHLAYCREQKGEILILIDIYAILWYSVISCFKRRENAEILHQNHRAGKRRCVAGSPGVCGSFRSEAGLCQSYRQDRCRSRFSDVGGASERNGENR